MQPKAWNYLRQLCDLPPRESAAEGERRAAAWLEERLRELGYDVSSQPFRSPRHTLYKGPLAVIVVMLVAIWFVPWPAVSFALGALALVPLVGEMLGARVNFDLILPKASSQNIVARPTFVGPQDDSSDGAARRAPIVFVAHYDAQWGSWLFSPGFRPFLRPFFVLTYAGLVAALIGLLLRWLLDTAWVDGMLYVAAGLLGAAGLFLLGAWVTGKTVLGANDNGSGVAVALSIAARWRLESPQHLEPMFLFTGCEEVGLRGMHRFLAATKLPPETIFVNLDNIGGGNLRYLTGEGMLIYQPYDPGLIQVARKVSENHGYGVEPLKNLLLPTDGLLPAKAGYPTITFIATDERDRILNYHWHTDTFANADQNTVELAEEYVWDYVMALDAEAKGPASADAGRREYPA